MSKYSCFGGRSTVTPTQGVVKVTVVYQPDNSLAISAPVKNPQQCSSTSNKQLLCMIGITIIPIMILVAVNSVSLYEATSESRAMINVRNRIQAGLEDFSFLIHRLEIERGTTALYLSSGSKSVYETLKECYNLTDEAIWNITNWKTKSSRNDGSIVYMTSVETFRAHIQSFRDKVDPNVTTLSQDLIFYTDVIDQIKNNFLSDFQKGASQGVWPKLVGFELLVQAKGYAGIKRALGSAFYAAGGFYDRSMYHWFLENSKYEEILLKSSNYYTPLVYIQSEPSIQEMEDEIKLNQVDIIDPSVIKGEEWFEKMTRHIDFLLDTQNKVAVDIMTDLDMALEALQVQYLIAVIVLSAVLLVAPVIVVAIYKQTIKIQRIGHTLQTRTMQLEEERSRAERLLHQMLPRTIAEQLKAAGTAHAEFFDDVTIFFSDLVNFTNICSQSSPMQVVEMLNTLYHCLDSLIERFDAYKVETIGDAYMVASGLPTPNGRQHAVELAMMSLAVRQSLRSLKIPHMPNQRYVVRIGLHTGPCAAGVVGKTMPRYCLFGDSVNTASRMESMGRANKIQISEATQVALTNNEDYGSKFTVKLRGKIQVKGKGDMVTFWLESRQSSLDFIGRGLSFEDD